MKALSITSAVIAVALSEGSAAQTLFTTEDYRRDTAHWTDPAYYNHNTARQLTDMQVNNRYAETGSGADVYALTTPYAYQTAAEHYRAWLDRAGGGTQHTFQTLPDWGGLWVAGPSWLDSVDVQASTVAAALTPQYREYYVQQVKAESEGRHWWASSFCLPDGFVRGLWRNHREFILRPDRIWILTSILTETQVRWLYTDGTGHSPEALQYPKWQGESIAFWDGDALIVHTNQIRAWTATHSLFEWSDQLSTVERYERVGDRIAGEITLYDPVAFIEPLHVALEYTLADTSGFRMGYDTCTDTNGPSSNIFINADGFLDERGPGDPGYWDPNDPRPWEAHYALGE